MPLVEGIFPFLVRDNVPGCNLPGMWEQGRQDFPTAPVFRPDPASMWLFAIPRCNSPFFSAFIFVYA
jgi:hypothetical protein